MAQLAMNQPWFGYPLETGAIRSRISGKSTGEPKQFSQQAQGVPMTRVAPAIRESMASRAEPSMGMKAVVLGPSPPVVSRHAMARAGKAEASPPESAKSHHLR